MKKTWFYVFFRKNHFYVSSLQKCPVKKGFSGKGQCLWKSRRWTINLNFDFLTKIDLFWEGGALKGPPLRKTDFSKKIPNRVFFIERFSVFSSFRIYIIFWKKLKFEGSYGRNIHPTSHFWRIFQRTETYNTTNRPSDLFKNFPSRNDI